MSNPKIEIIHRTFLDGRLHHERREKRVVYTKKDGSKWANHWGGGKRQLKEEGGELVMEHHVRLVGKAVLS